MKRPHPLWLLAAAGPLFLGCSSNPGDGANRPAAGTGGTPAAPAAAASTPAPLPPATVRLSFDKDAAGLPPSGFTFVRTGGGKDGRWTIQQEATAPSPSHVLMQTSDEISDSRFLMAALLSPIWKDFRTEVKFRPVMGKGAQSGGLAFRYQDASNHYLVRANALEGNCRLFRVAGGQRVQIASKDKLTIASGQWHTLAVECKGKTLRCWLDGAEVIAVKDDQFLQAGKIGLWTESDSVTQFDDLLVEIPTDK